MIQLYEIDITGSGSNMRKLRLPTLPMTRCRHLTPPPSSTNVERLFSYGGFVATDHRSSLSGEKLDQILFRLDESVQV